VSEGSPIAAILITFGGLFLLGLVADLAGRHSPLPRVTLLLIAGFLIGPSVLDWLPPFTDQWFTVLTNIALALIGFLLGQNLTAERFRELGRPVLTMSVSEVVGTSLLVFAALALVGVPLELALLLAGVAPATAPAATVDVVRSSEAKGRFTDTLLGIVAIDDLWGLLAFTLLLAVAEALGERSGAAPMLLHGLREVGGAVLLGVALGYPMAKLTGRIRPGEPTQAEALGLVLLTAGLAEWLQVSYILAAMTLGVMVANLASHHERPFREIEGIEWPFLILFFLLAGASLHLDALATAGWLAAGYIGLRVAGRMIGTRLGGHLSGAEPQTRRWIGIALLPQAGVAVGMALLAAQRFPELADRILPVILGSTVVFEVVGPVLTRYALTRVGDIPAASKGREAGA